MLAKKTVFGAYLGQEVVTSVNTEQQILTSIYADNKIGVEYDDGSYAVLNIDDCKLVLRTYKDMTREELNSYLKLNNDNFLVEGLFRTFDDVYYLISIGIDIFGLIEKGWAIRKEKKDVN